MKWPLAQVTSAYVVGIILGAFLQLDLIRLLALTCVIAWAAVFFALNRTILLWVSLILIGWCNIISRTARTRPDDLRQLIGERRFTVRIEGRLSTTPVQRAFDQHTEHRVRTLAQVEVTSLSTRNGKYPAIGTIVVSTPGSLSSDYYGGRKIEVTGVIHRPAGPLAEGLFNYREHLKWKGIYYQLHVRGTNEWKLLPADTTVPLPDRIVAWARKTLALGLPTEDEPLKIIWAMALGWDTGMTNEVAEPLMKSGTMHIVAISGLHIAIIAGVLIQFLRFVRVSRFTSVWLIIPAIWIYTWITGWQPSAIRSTIMSTVIFAGWSIKRPSNLVNSLAGAGFIILLWQPQQLFQVSFQLSFFVVLAIGVLLPPLEKLRDRLIQTDPLIPIPLIPEWKKALRRIVRWLLSALAVSVTAWIGSAPLIGFYFHLITPGSLLANLIVVPLSNASLACNMLSLGFGAWLPRCSEIFNHCAWFFMTCVMWCSHWVTTLPASYWHVRAPSAMQFVIYYGALFAFLLAWEKRWWNRKAFWIGISSAAIVFPFAGRHFESAMRISVLSLGGGSSIYVETPKLTDSLLIDCGDEHSVEWVIKPALHAQGVNQLPHLVITHGDINEVGGAPSIVREFSPRDVILSELNFRSPTYRQSVAQLQNQAVKIQRIHRGNSIGSFEVLHPAPADRARRADDGCLVLRGIYHGQRMLMVSDLSGVGQKQLMEREGTNNLRADVLIAGMPAYEEPMTEEFLDAVRPRAIVLATGIHPASQVPKRALRQRLAKRKVPVFYTGDSGSLTIEFTRNGWRILDAEANETAMLQSKRE